MIARGGSQPEPTTWDELVLWMREEARRLVRKVKRMPCRTARDRSERDRVMVHGMTKTALEVRRLDKKIRKGADNDRAQAPDYP